MRIVLFGDSIFAGHGLEPDQGPAARLQAMLGDAATVRAAGIADQTSADGLARVGTIEGDLILVEFGLNDAIEGVRRDQTIANLQGITAALGSSAMLVEALVPAGSAWPARSDLAGVAATAARGAPYVPDVLAGLPARGLMQADGLHPDAAGAALLAGRLRDGLNLLKPHRRVAMMQIEESADLNRGADDA